MHATHQTVWSTHCGDGSFFLRDETHLDMDEREGIYILEAAIRPATTVDLCESINVGSGLYRNRYSGLSFPLEGTNGVR
jgi:hypothetical protein